MLKYRRRLATGQYGPTSVGTDKEIGGPTKCFARWKVIVALSGNIIRCDHSMLLRELVTSPTRKKAWKMNRYNARSKVAAYAVEVTSVQESHNVCRIGIVIGYLSSEDG